MNDAGSGFYAKAREVDLFQDGMEKVEFWIRQVKAVHAKYGRTQRLTVEMWCQKDLAAPD